MREKIKSIRLKNKDYFYTLEKKEDYGVRKYMTYDNPDPIDYSTDLSAAKDIANDVNLENIISKKEMKKNILKTLSLLSDKQEKVLRMYFGYGYDKPYSYTEIAKEHKVSKQSVQFLMIKAIRKFKKLYKMNMITNTIPNNPYRKVA